MIRTIQASALALTLTLGAIAPQQAAAASDRDVSRAIIGALALFTIGTAIANAKNEAPKASAPRTTYGTTRSYDGPHWGEREREHEHKFERRHERARVIPSICTQTRGDHMRRYIPARCLARNMRGAQNLPRECRVRLETRRGPSTAYAAHCLRRHGFVTEARLKRH